MIIFRRTVSIPVAVLAALVLGTATAMATEQTFTVSAGSAPEGTVVEWTGSTVEDADRPGGPHVLFQNPTRGIEMTCESGAMTGTVTTGTDLSGSGGGTIADFALIDCAGLGMAWEYSPRNLPWGINITSKSSGGVVGEIVGVDLVVRDSDTDGDQCYFELTGSLAFSYSNATQTLETTGADLIVNDVSGALCPLMMGDGDAASLDMTYLVEADDPAENPIAIT